MALEKWKILMEKVLVTTTIHLQLPFSLSLCNPLFHLTEAGNVKTKPSAPNAQHLSTGIAELLTPAPSPPSILFSCRCNLFMDRECHWGAPQASLFFEADDADVAGQCLLLPFLLLRTQRLAVRGHDGLWQAV